MFCIIYDERNKKIHLNDVGTINARCLELFSNDYYNYPCRKENRTMSFLSNVYLSSSSMLIEFTAEWEYHAV